VLEWVGPAYGASDTDRVQVAVWVLAHNLRLVGLVNPTGPTVVQLHLRNPRPRTRQRNSCCAALSCALLVSSSRVLVHARETPAV
jgi:hypothetical protein